MLAWVSCEYTSVIGISFFSVYSNILMKSTKALKFTIFINWTSSLQFVASFVITYHIFTCIYNKTMKYW